MEDTTFKLNPEPDAKPVRDTGFDLDEARTLAAANGLLLIQRTQWHYQLKNGPTSKAWLINLYPSRGTIWEDPKRPDAPLLLLQPGWTLTDAVRDGIRAVGETLQT